MFDNIRESARVRRELEAARVRIAILETKLEEEREARLIDNREWGNRFLKSHGQFGIETHKTIAQPVEQPKSADVPSIILNAVEEATLAKYIEEAPKYGYTTQQAEELFWAHKRGLKADNPQGDGQVEWEH